MAISQITAVINGQTYTLTYNETTRRYEAVIPALATSYHQDGGYYNASVTATNDSGVTATTDGANLPGLRLVVRETTAPTITLVSPAAGFVTTNRPTVTVDITDESGGSGVDISTVQMSIDGLPGGTVTQAITNGYRASWTPTNPLTEGNHSLTVTVEDYDGNPASLAAAYVVDTVPPELYVDGYRQIVDTEGIVVTGAVRDVTAPPVALTVAGVEVTPDKFGRFETTVPLDVGENHFDITVTDQAGLVTTQSLYAIRLITDRTQADVDRLIALLAKQSWTSEELALFAQANSKGAYNYTDMNRVTIAVAFLSGLLFRRGYLDPYRPVNPAQGRTEWYQSDIPTLSQTQGYVDNVARIRNTLSVKAPEAPPDMQNWNFREANDLEKILVQVESIFPLLDQSYIMAGEAVCGEF